MTDTSWDRLTDEHMENPQVGDLFHEMYSYWVKVVARDGDSLVTAEGNDRKRERVAHASIADFKARFAYGSIPGYSILYYSRLPLKD